LYTDFDFIDGDGNVLCQRLHMNHSFGAPHPKKNEDDILLKDIFVMPGLMTAKKSILEEVGGFDENLSGYEDDDLFLRLFGKSQIAYFPFPTLRWRIYDGNYSLSYRMPKSRSYYWRKLLKNHTSNGANLPRVHAISCRFFQEFINQALKQYAVGNELFRLNIDGAREIVPYLPGLKKIFYRCVFLLPLKQTMSILSALDLPKRP